MPRTLVPSSARLKEHHYCRWLQVSLLKILEEEQLKGSPNKILIRTQRDQFVESGDEIFLFPLHMHCVCAPK